MAASAAHADATARTRHEIAELYQKRHAAADNRDLDGLLAPLSPGFVYVYPDGRRQNYAHTRQKLIEMLAYARAIKSESVLQDFAIHGSQATVRVRSHVVLTYLPNRQVIPLRLLRSAALENPDATESKVVTDEAWGVSEDTWVKTASGWKVSRTRMITERHKVKEAP